MLSELFVYRLASLHDPHPHALGAFVVIAADPQQARELAASHSIDPEFWLDSETSTCRQIDVVDQIEHPAVVPHVVLRSYNQW